MNKNPVISVIVPVYKVEKYLNRCIESILSQTYTDFEVLLIDDGSPDNSGKICDEYSRKDSRIKVIHKENGGVSSSRNLGLQIARGEWICFVDSDDWLDTNLFSICATYFDYDIVRFSANFVLSEDSKKILRYHIDETLSKDELLSQIISRGTLLTVWSGLFKKKLFLDIPQFDVNLKNGEDWIILIDLVKQASSIKILDIPLYNYNQYNVNSCVAHLDIVKIQNVLDVTSIIEQRINASQYLCELLNVRVEMAYILLRIAPKKQLKTCYQYLFTHLNLRLDDIWNSSNNIKIKLTLTLHFAKYFIFS